MNTIFKLLFLFVVAFYLVKYVYKFFLLFKPQNTFGGNNKSNDFVDYSQANTRKTKTSKEGDYVDFEEVK